MGSQHRNSEVELLCLVVIGMGITGSPSLTSTRPMQWKENGNSKSLVGMLKGKGGIREIQMYHRGHRGLRGAWRRDEIRE